MTKTQERSKGNNNNGNAIAIAVNPLLVTPSLLNSWGYIYLAPMNVREAENDTICIEDKAEILREKATEDFLKTLNRIPSEPNEAMQKGIDFERDCYLGKTPISPIIKGGAFQIVGKKETEINGEKVLLYGRLDVLKNGTIYDIKRVRQYKVQKYAKSYQHGFYMDLFQEANEFTYLVYDDNEKLHQETYYRGQYKPTECVVSEFFDWLKEYDLWETYKRFWRKGEKTK